MQCHTRQRVGQPHEAGVTTDPTSSGTSGAHNSTLLRLWRVLCTASTR